MSKVTQLAIELGSKPRSSEPMSVFVAHLQKASDFWGAFFPLTCPLTSPSRLKLPSPHSLDCLPLILLFLFFLTVGLQQKERGLSSERRLGVPWPRQGNETGLLGKKCRALFLLLPSEDPLPLWPGHCLGLASRWAGPSGSKPAGLWRARKPSLGGWLPCLPQPSRKGVPACAFPGAGGESGQVCRPVAALP